MPSDTVEEGELATALDGIQDVLANFLPHLRYLAVTARTNVLRDDPDGYWLEIPMPIEQSTWWRIHRHGGGSDGMEMAMAERIPEWKGENLRDRIRGMDYSTLMNLKPDEMESN